MFLAVIRAPVDVVQPSIKIQFRIYMPWQIAYRFEFLKQVSVLDLMKSAGTSRRYPMQHTQPEIVKGHGWPATISVSVVVRTSRARQRY